MLVLSGCGPELAQTQLGAEEELWQAQIRSSYSSWRAPRSAPPAISDNRDPSLTARQEPVGESSGLTVEPKTPAPDAPAPDTVGIPKDSPETPAAAEKNAPAAEKSAPAAEKNAPAPEKNAPAPEKNAPAAEKNAPAPEEEGVAAPAADGTETYIVKKGDTLSKLAKTFYGDGRQYMKLVKANESQLKGNPNRIYPGMKLVIPKR